MSRSTPKQRGANSMSEKLQVPYPDIDAAAKVFYRQHKFAVHTMDEVGPEIVRLQAEIGQAEKDNDAIGNEQSKKSYRAKKFLGLVAVQEKADPWPNEEQLLFLNGMNRVSGEGLYNRNLVKSKDHVDANLDKYVANAKEQAREDGAEIHT